MKRCGAVLVLVVFCFLGCRSSDSSSSGTVSGQFIDAVVAGLEFRTASTRGVTDVNGTFEYQPGESVAFFLGDVALGETLGSAILTVVDIAGATDIDDDRALNIARLLQSLDEDCNPENGIRITEQVRTEVDGRFIDFDKSPAEFHDPPVTVSAVFDIVVLQAVPGVVDGDALDLPVQLV